jgi:hypothetical protein
VLIVIDSNVLFDDAFMRRPPARDVLDSLDAAECTLVFSPVVLGELKRHSEDGVNSLADQIQSRAKRLARRAGTDLGDLVEDVERARRHAHERWASGLKELTSYARVEVGPWPTASLQDMVTRELGRRRPFLDKEPGTIGHRDTVLWLGVVALAKRNPEQQVVFVTADNGFLTKGGLHEDLLRDLDDANVPRSAVRHLHSLVALLELMTEEGVAAWRRTAAAEAVSALVGQLSVEEFAPTWNPRDGGYDDPPHDVGLTRVVDEWTIENIDGPESLTFDDSEAAESGNMNCTFRVDVSFAGFMDKSEWFMDDHPGVELWDSDWNDHYVAVEAHRTLELVVSIWIDEENEHLEVEEIEQVSVVSDLDH